jgi:hypothetical protein
MCQDLCTAEAPACCTTELRCVSTEPHCRLDVLSHRVTIASDYADLQQKIAALPGDLLLSVADTDVKSAAAEPPAAARFEFDLTPEASVANGPSLVNATAVGYPFRVSCNDEELFVGELYFEDGQAALNVPVLYAKYADDGTTVVIELGAWEGAWTGAEAYEYDGTEAERERIDRPELRAAFCARGILGELPVPQK